MGNDQGQPKTVDFTLDARTPSKRPEQLAALLEQALQREFPESGAVVEISHTPQTSVVSLRNLEQLEEGTATALTHKARAIYNEFMMAGCACLKSFRIPYRSRRPSGTLLCTRWSHLPL